MNINDENNNFSDNSQETTSQSSRDLKNELEECQALVSAWKDKYVFLAADFENYKKRLEKDRVTYEFMTKKRLVFPILTILDNVDRALAQEKKAKTDDTQYVGFAMIAKELSKVLESFGVKPMENYSVFDPEYHESITHVASENHTSGDIVEVLEKGYMLGDAVLRPAKVAVAQ